MKVCDRIIWIPREDPTTERVPLGADSCDYAMDYVWMDRACVLQAHVSRYTGGYGHPAQVSWPGRGF